MAIFIEKMHRIFTLIKSYTAESFKMVTSYRTKDTLSLEHSYTFEGKH